MLPLDSPSPNGLFFSADCLRPPQTITFTTNGSQPSATYTGNRYGGDITNKVPNLPSCGYDAANMQQAYGLADLYKNHLDGTGQTIVIVDAFGSNTILSDANLFSALNGLPTFTPSNFAIFKPNGSATCGQSCIAGNWQFETTLDVEWAHAIAPGANVALVLSVDNRFAKPGHRQSVRHRKWAWQRHFKQLWYPGNCARRASPIGTHCREPHLGNRSCCRHFSASLDRRFGRQSGNQESRPSGRLSRFIFIQSLRFCPIFEAMWQ